jgi:hypothetical protein
LAFNPVADTYVDKGDQASALEPCGDQRRRFAGHMSFLRFNLAGLAPFAVQQARVRLTVDFTEGPSE